MHKQNLQIKLIKTYILYYTNINTSASNYIKFRKILQHFFEKKDVKENHSTAYPFISYSQFNFTHTKIFILEVLFLLFQIM